MNENFHGAILYSLREFTQSCSDKVGVDFSDAKICELYLKHLREIEGFSSYLFSTACYRLFRTDFHNFNRWLTKYENRLGIEVFNYDLNPSEESIEEIFSIVQRISIMSSRSLSHWSLTRKIYLENPKKLDIESLTQTRLGQLLSTIPGGLDGALQDDDVQNSRYTILRNQFIRAKAITLGLENLSQDTLQSITLPEYFQSRDL